MAVAMFTSDVMVLLFNAGRRTSLYKCNTLISYKALVVLTWKIGLASWCCTHFSG